MRISMYVNEEEHQWIKSQPEGTLRRLIQEEMGGGANMEKKKTIKESPRKNIDIENTSKGDGLHTCKKCGYLLPYYKGKCKNC